MLKLLYLAYLIHTAELAAVAGLSLGENPKPFMEAI
jgi:hypothetical protein